MNRGRRGMSLQVTKARSCVNPSSDRPCHRAEMWFCRGHSLLRIGCGEIEVLKAIPARVRAAGWTSTLPCRWTSFLPSGTPGARSSLVTVASVSHISGWCEAAGPAGSVAAASGVGSSEPTGSLVPAWKSTAQAKARRGGRGHRPPGEGRRARRAGSRGQGVWGQGYHRVRCA